MVKVDRFPPARSSAWGLLIPLAVVQFCPDATYIVVVVFR